MARLVENRHQKDKVSMKSYAQLIGTSRFIYHHNWEILCDHSKKKIIILLISYNFLISSQILELGIDNLHDLQLLTRRDNSRFIPTTEIVEVAVPITVLHPLVGSIDKRKGRVCHREWFKTRQCHPYTYILIITDLGRCLRLRSGVWHSPVDLHVKNKRFDDIIFGWFIFVLLFTCCWGVVIFFILTGI